MRSGTTIPGDSEAIPERSPKTLLIPSCSDKKSSQERVTLTHEEIEPYEPSYYGYNSSELSREFSLRWSGTEQRFVGSMPKRGCRN